VELFAPHPERTSAFGEALGRSLVSGDVIGLVGDLGAGKTLFVQGVGRGLAIPQSVRVNSPTFTLLNEYRGGRFTLFHADLYRLEKASELREIGLEDAMDSDGVVMIEWSDRFPILPPDHLELRFRVAGETARALVARAHGPRSVRLLERWQTVMPASCA
jgi:tRNA threonylcarbamoyladenosine biosynthesis protein TsaE